jgi:hypothetical protein
MTIIFQNDNDVIVYALEKIISYARRSQQIFVAQCVWWLASIIGLEQGLIIYIDTIEQRLNITNKESGQPVTKPDTTIQDGKLVSPMPRDIQEDPRLRPEEDWIHPERRNQVDKTNHNICDLNLNDTNNNPRLEVIESTKFFLAKSRKERKALNKQRKDQLSRTRSGKIREKPLTAGQRKYLQGIPKEIISEYLIDRK